MSTKDMRFATFVLPPAQQAWLEHLCEVHGVNFVGGMVGAQGQTVAELRKGGTAKENTIDRVAEVLARDEALVRRRCGS